MATRRKHLAIREPNGRAKRSPLPRMLAPSEVRRLRDAAMAGLRAAEWGTCLGWIYLEKHITESQYAAGRLWGEIMQDYHTATQGPKSPRTANLDPSGGTPVDPDSALGHREAHRHVLAVNMAQRGILALKLIGDPVRSVVVDVCEKDEYLVSMDQVEHLRKGLDLLARVWGGRR